MLSIITAILILCLSFAAAALGAYIVIGLVSRPSEWSFLTRRLIFLTASTRLPENSPAGLIDPGQSSEKRGKIEARLADLLRQGGLNLNPAYLLAGIIWTATIVATVSFVAFILSGAGYSVGVFFAPLVVSGIVLTVILLAVAGFARDRRMRLLEGQLPGTLEIIQSGLKAGQPFLSALTLSSNEVGQPLQNELRRTADEIRYGSDVQIAFWRLADRTGLADFRYLATGVAASLEAGTSLVKLLADTAQTIRSRQTLRKKVRSLSSESELSAKMMMLMPPVFAGGVSLLNPGYYGNYLQDADFLRVAAFFLVLYVIGALWLHMIVKNGIRGL